MDPQPDVEPPVGKGPFTCEYCNTTLEKYPQYKKHLKRHLEDKPYRCCECQASFNVQVYTTSFMWYGKLLRLALGVVFHYHLFHSLMYAYSYGYSIYFAFSIPRKTCGFMKLCT